MGLAFALAAARDVRLFYPLFAPVTWIALRSGVPGAMLPERVGCELTHLRMRLCSESAASDAFSTATNNSGVHRRE